MPQQMDDELLQQAQAGEESAIAALPYAKAPLPLQHPALTLTMRCRKG